MFTAWALLCFVSIRNMSILSIFFRINVTGDEAAGEINNIQYIIPRIMLIVPALLCLYFAIFTRIQQGYVTGTGAAG